MLGKLPPPENDPGLGMVKVVFGGVGLLAKRKNVPCSGPLEKHRDVLQVACHPHVGQAIRLAVACFECGEAAIEWQLLCVDVSRWRDGDFYFYRGPGAYSNGTVLTSATGRLSDCVVSLTYSAENANSAHSSTVELGNCEAERDPTAKVYTVAALACPRV